MTYSWCTVVQWRICASWRVCVCVWQSPLANDSYHCKRKCIFVHLYQLILLYNNSIHCYSFSWLGCSYIPNQLPNCLQQSKCAKVNDGSAGQKGPPFLYNLKCQLHVNKVQPLDGILCQLNGISSLTPPFLVMHLNIIIEPTPCSQKRLLYFRPFVYNFLYISSICWLSAFSVYFILNSITVMILDT